MQGLNKEGKVKYGNTKFVVCIPGVGQVADFRKIIYDIQNCEWKWSNVGYLLLNSIGFIPLI